MIIQVKDQSKNDSQKNALHPENKTVVFSGSGSMRRPVLDDKGEATRENDTTFSSPSYELWLRRLAQMSAAEEVGHRIRQEGTRL